MPRTKKVELHVEEPTVEAVPNVAVAQTLSTPKVEPITQEFGNGELNVLRDKVNEIIRSL